MKRLVAVNRAGAVTIFRVGRTGDIFKIARVLVWVPHSGIVGALSCEHFQTDFFGDCY